MVFMLMLEAFLKFGTIAMLVALGWLIVRDARHVSTFRFALPLIVSMICMFLTTGPTGSEGLRITGPIAIPLRLVDMLNLIFIWWLGLALFDDDFRLGKRELGVALLYVIMATPVRLHYLGIDILWIAGIDLPVSIFAVGLMLHLAYRAMVGRHEDLIEKRRGARVFFASAIAILVIVSIVSERISFAMQTDPRASIWITYAFTLPLTLWALLWLTRLHPEVLAFQTKSAAKTEELESDLRYAELNKRLKVIMSVERGYAEHGLTIGSLAKRVDMPAHQLRSFINKTMGYRNFSAYLNHYRIQDIKHALADPDKARIPILTLAMDAGFSSLAPFNRAFKASEGVTPRDYRHDALTKLGSATVQN